MDTSSRYIPSSKIREGEIIVGGSVIVTGLVAFFFYRSIYGAAVFPLCLFFVSKLLRQEFNNRRRNRCLDEFKEMLSCISSSLKAGHSLESSLKDLERDFRHLYGDTSLLLEGIISIKQKLAMNVPSEKAIEEFCQTYGYEEMMNFSFMMSYAKRLGGNYVKNISTAASKLQQRLEIKKEIESTIAEKRLELRVMVAMPLGILIYVGCASYDFISGLYGNLLGVLVMSLALIIYGICIYAGRRIVDIKY